MDLFFIYNVWYTVFSFLQGLCSWAINIIGFYEVYCDVEPKRKALAAANAELAAAQEKLAKIKTKIQVSSKLLFIYKHMLLVHFICILVWPAVHLQFYFTIMSRGGVWM